MLTLRQGYSSRHSHFFLQNPGHYDFLVDIPSDKATVDTVLPDLQKICKDVNVLGTSQEVPWFPRKISDLDRYADRVLEVWIRLKKALADECNEKMVICRMH